MPGVCTYLNFNRSTEAAFLFYQSVFGGEFSHGVISRFGDFPQVEGMPEVPESDKQLVMHVELPILGDYVLMGTDAPESMGFSLQQGNNVHICLEPESRAETQRLFNLLAAGGNITSPLIDTFRGAYYGTCTDKFGIQWMFNFIVNK